MAFSKWNIPMEIIVCMWGCGILIYHCLHPNRVVLCPCPCIRCHLLSTILTQRHHQPRHITISVHAKIVPFQTSSQLGIIVHQRWDTCSTYTVWYLKDIENHHRNWSRQVPCLRVPGNMVSLEFLVAGRGNSLDPPRYDTLIGVIVDMGVTENGICHDMPT